MVKWCRGFAGTLGFALCHGNDAWAQGPARAEQSSGAVWFTLLILFLPVLFVVLFLTPSLRRAKRSMNQVERSLAMAEESLLLAREQVALQKDSNRLLGNLLEELSRD
jgi:hypothetical protein